VLRALGHLMASADGISILSRLIGERDASPPYLHVALEALDVGEMFMTLSCPVLEG